MHSGEFADQDLRTDLETANADGEEQFQTFLKYHIFARAKSFDATTHRNKRKNFLTPIATKKTTQVPKTAAMEKKTRLCVRLFHCAARGKSV